MINVKRTRLLEFSLIALILFGIGMMFAPGVWRPIVQTLDQESETTAPPVSVAEQLPPTLLKAIPKPHWIEDRDSVQKIRSQNEFRTGTASDGDFVPIQQREEVVVETLPGLPVLETQAPVPPGEEWQMLEIDATGVQNPQPEIEIPGILPSDISDEVVGQIRPILTEPNVQGTLTPTVGTPTIQTETPRWWIQSAQASQLPNRVAQSINLDQVIWMALQQAPEIQVLNTVPEIRRTQIDQSIANFDWSAFIETLWTDTNEPVGSLLQTGTAGGRFLQQEFAFEGGLKKRLATGGDLRVAQSFGRINNNSSFLQPPDQSVSRLEIDYRQPLMRGAGSRYATTQIVLAKLNFEQTESDSLQRIQGYLIEVVTAYWNLYQQRALLIQGRENLRRAQMLRQSLIEKNASIASIARAEAAITERQTLVLKAEYQVLNSQDQLANLTMGPRSQQIQGLELIPESMAIPEFTPMHAETLTYAALNNRPEVRQAVSKIKAASAKEYVAINELLPQLDAIVSTYVSGLRGGFDGSGAFSDQFSAGDPSYSVGFGFELPVGNRVAKSKLQRQQLQTRILGHQFQKTLGDVVLDVRITYRNLERLHREIQTNSNGLVQAQNELAQIQQQISQHANGQDTSSLLVENLLASQTRLTAAENRLLISQTQYAVALVDLKRATGELVNGRFRMDSVQPVEYMEPRPADSGTPLPIPRPQFSSTTTTETPVNQTGNQPSVSNGNFSRTIETTPEAVQWQSTGSDR